MVLNVLKLGEPERPEVKSRVKLSMAMFIIFLTGYGVDET